MDPNNPVFKLCVEGTQAEFNGQVETAKSHYQHAWRTASDSFEDCVAAHYVWSGRWTRYTYQPK